MGSPRAFVGGRHARREEKRRERSIIVSRAGWLVCSVLLWSSSALADYGEEAKLEMARQTQGQLGFTEAKVLRQQHRNTREGTIRRLSATVEKVMTRTLKNSGVSFDADQVLNLRSVSAFHTGTAVTEEEERSRPRPVTGELIVRETEDSTEIERANLFSVRIFADGDAFKFRNRAADIGSNRHRPSKLDEATAEKLGRQLILELDLVPRGERDQLKFVKTRYVHFTGQAADPGDRVVATEIYFGRAIESIPVVGPRGSLIKLELSGEHITSLTVDWASYAAPAEDALTQQPLDREQMDLRLVKHLEKLSGRARGDTLVTSRACGYIDLGNRRPNDNTLQLGCLLTYAAGETSQVAVLPLAKQPIKDDSWRATAELLVDEQPGKVVQAELTREVRFDEETDGSSDQPGWSCTLGTRPDSDSRWGFLVVAIGLGACLRRRVRSGHARSGTALGAVLAVWFAPGIAGAVQGQLDYNTFMIKNYTGGTCADFDATQWENYNDWTDEMSDESTCYRCIKDSDSFTAYLFGGFREHGWNADLVAVATHGTWSLDSTGVHHGYLYDRACVKRDINNMEPLDGEMEIALIWACSTYSRYEYDLWSTFRNLHRFGAPVSAGCWGTCTLIDGTGTTTFNEIGDELADGRSSVYHAWTDGHSVGAVNDDIMVIGLGEYGGSDCALAARSAGFHNRMDYEGPSYARNRAFRSKVGDPELCGYYWDNI